MTVSVFARSGTLTRKHLLHETELQTNAGNIQRHRACVSLFIYQIWLIELSLYLYRVCYKLRDTNLGQTSNSGKEKLPFIRKDP